MIVSRFIPALFIIFTATINVSQSATIDIAPIEIPEELKDILEKVPYTIDAYGNIRIFLKDIKIEPTIDVLKKIKEQAEKKFKNRGVFIHIHLSQSPVFEEFKKIGFDLYQLDQRKEELTFLFRNGRAIPFLDTAFVTASIFITRINKDGHEELLVIDEYNKKDLTVPAGSVDTNELALDGILREVKEEVGIDLSSFDIKLFSIRNRTCQIQERSATQVKFF